MTAEPNRRGRPRKAEGPDTREKLLAAALDLFAAQGFAATSVRQIAEAVGVRDSAIYGHFEGKQAILDVLMERAGPGVLKLSGFDPASMAAASPDKALSGLFGRIVAHWAEPEVRKFTSMMLRDGADGVAIVTRNGFAHFLRHGRVGSESRKCGGGGKCDLLHANNPLPSGPFA